MPKIQLKPNSAEYADDTRKKPLRRRCDMPGCAQEGEYRAPKDRELSAYYHFCLEHVSEYNKAWNYFSGMSHSEMEAYIIRSALWDRPTRKFSDYADLKEQLYQKAWRTYHFTDAKTGKADEKADETSERFRQSTTNRNSPEYEAMAIMGLEPPLNLPDIKARYKELVKRYHPDINRDDPKAEDILKSVNMAYTILKMAFEKFEALPERT